MPEVHPHIEYLTHLSRFDICLYLVRSRQRRLLSKLTIKLTVGSRAFEVWKGGLHRRVNHLRLGVGTTRTQLKSSYRTTVDTFQGGVVSAILAALTMDLSLSNHQVCSYVIAAALFTNFRNFGATVLTSNYQPDNIYVNANLPSRKPCTS